MRKATATYTAPKGDSKVVEMGGVTFFDGQPVDLNSDEHPRLIAKLPGNPHFNIEISEGDSIAENDDDDAVTDKYHTMNVADLRKEATSREIDTTGMSKAEIREALREADAH
jgi:hypothetical protein